MTQLSTRPVAPGAEIVPPRPRGARPLRALEPVPAADRAADPTADRAPATAPRRRPSWVPFASEVAASLAVAPVVTVVLGAPPALAAVSAVVWLLLLAVCGHHRRPALGESRTTAVSRVLLTGAKALVLAAASVPHLRGVPDPGDLLWLVVALTVTSTVVAAALPGRTARVVVVGDPREVRDVLAELGSGSRHEVVAVCLTRRTSTAVRDLPVYTGISSAPRAIAQHAAEAVVVLPGRHVSRVDLRRLQWAVAGSGAALYLGTGLLDVAPRRTRVLSSSGLDVLHVAPAALTGPRRVLKDVAERGLALAGVVVLSPLLLTLAVLVRRDSPGPALFRQERVGRDGQTFQMLKLRSMSTSAESDRTGLSGSNEADGVLFKIQQDPRITPVGRWLRRYSLDELPQLWNVVRGDMSLVGPRPALPEEVARYEVDPLRRLVVKPGVTGLWQVSGRSDLSWEESVRLDLRYVDNWSLALDVAILARTVRAVLGHRGAY